MDLARRFRGLPADALRTARSAPYRYSVGDSADFALVNLESPSLYTLAATVRLITDHAYWFVEDGAQAGSLATAAADFESQVYPTVTQAFGSEWSPGVDSDPRITILHARLSGAGGYVSASDEFPGTAVPRSNEREMLYLEADTTASPGVVYNALAAHELQHLIHWHADPNEDVWVNEGLSEVAAELVGGGTSRVQRFLASPDTQLNFWPGAGGDTRVHYAASQLFFRYLLDRFGGRDKAKELLAIKADSIAGVEQYLEPFKTTFREVFAGWVIANYRDEESGPYAHLNADARVAVTANISEPGGGADSVHQFAADYLEVDLPGPHTFTFDGADDVSIGIPPRNGPFWWSNRGDSIDSRLTRELDLRNVPAATLRFRTWFDIEDGWDYAYVAASTDGGKTWKALRGRHTTDDDPVGAAYGPGYTGASGEGASGWLQEEIDLSAYAGKKLLLRFEQVTDDSTNLAGFAVDDIEVPELGFQDGADGDNGWTAEGFRRIEEPLAQDFIVQVVARNGSVKRVKLDASNRAEIALDGPSTVVVAAVTEGTAEEADYTWSLAAR